MRLYYITDRQQFSGTDREKRERLLNKIGEAARARVDYIQLREKDLRPRELVELAREAVRRIRAAIGQSDKSDVEAFGTRPKIEIRTPKLLINSRVDVALASGADGVHLTSTDMPASDARAVWTATQFQLGRSQPVIAASCHTPEEVRLAEAHGADFAVFGPVFEKVMPPMQSGVGIAALREACAKSSVSAGPEPSAPVHMPVLALGGVTVGNATECIAAGAAGIAAIRLFQENELAATVAKLRGVQANLT